MTHRFHVARLPLTVTLTRHATAMNRYPLWKYILIAIALVVGLVYTVPNLFGEVPAVQVSPVRATLKSDAALLARVEESFRRTRSFPRATFLDADGRQGATRGSRDTDTGARSAAERTRR